MKKIVMTAIALLLGSMAWAGDNGAPKEGQWFLSPLLGFYEPPEDSEIDGAVGGGFALGAGITERFAAEILYFQFEGEYEANGNSGRDDGDTWFLDVLYMPERETGNWQPFLLGSVGRADLDYDDDGDSFTDNQIGVGAGVFGKINNRFSARADVRGIYSNEFGSVEPMVLVGLNWYLNSVEPPIPPDTDGDGVIDANDKCPNTPLGVAVGADGCELDSDGDGVLDSADRCPNTPAGVSVDSRGCPLDSDGDGVADYMDECPNTAAGVTVDSRGCVPDIEEEVTIDLSLEFDTDSAQLRNSHYAEIQTVVSFMKQFSNTTAVIEGHTDSRGAESYNQALSERRAASVRNYLVNEGDIASDRLTSRGYGESQPADTNDTAEGRQRNRRVSAVVSGKATVKAGD
ncbi:MAG: OmpA family protein [Pseudomonadaceae bacterium]|nr:OmpA family protein [Pseudomonadaceae bacterium]